MPIALFQWKKSNSTIIGPRVCAHAHMHVHTRNVCAFTKYSRLKSVWVGAWHPHTFKPR